MGKFFFPLILSLLFVGCGTPFTYEDTIGFDSNGMDKDPPKLLVCDYPLMGCGGKVCVDVSRDRNNCGWCGIQCGKLEMCYAYHCADATSFGFSEADLVLGPVTYLPHKDLPRQNPVHSDDR